MKKIFNVTRERWFLFLLFLVFSTHLSQQAYCQDSGLTFALKNATLKEIINEIKRISSYDFVYTDSHLDAFKQRDVAYKNASIGNILTDCLKGTGLTYAMNGSTIIIRKETVKSDQQAMKKVIGRVTDEKGEPLPGVTVIIKGTTQGTATDMDGNYSLLVPTGKCVLLFTMVGMETQEYPGEFVNDETQVNVVMKNAVRELDDVVVTGYFNKSKESFTGAVTSVKWKNCGSLGT